MTEDDIVERGLIAQQILNDQAFLGFVQDTQDMIKEALINTDFADVAERERLYYRYKAMDDIIGTMKTYIAIKDEVAAKREAKENQGLVDYP